MRHIRAAQQIRRYRDESRHSAQYGTITQNDIATLRPLHQHAPCHRTDDDITHQQALIFDDETRNDRRHNAKQIGIEPAHDDEHDHRARRKRE